MNLKDQHTSQKTAGAIEYHYTALLRSAEYSGCVAIVPALPGLLVEGETFEEARKMIKDAIQSYLRYLRKTGQQIPTEERNAITENITVTLPRA